MKLKYIFCGFLAFSAIVGWNAFLAHRDAELFKVQDQQVQSIK